MRGLLFGTAFLAALAPAPLHAAEIKLATWDFGWLTTRAAGDPALPEHVSPKRPADVARLGAYATALGADVVAFQGVDGAEVAGAVFAAPGYRLEVAGDAVLQRTGFAVRTGFSVERNPDLAALNPYPDARFPLRAGADVTVGVGSARLRLLSVHLKSGCRDGPLDAPGRGDCRTLARQGTALAGWIAARLAAGEAFAVLGDFGRVMEGADPFLAGLAPPGALLRATAGHASPCWGGQDFVDHILLGGAARDWLIAGSLRVLAYRDNEARARLSDHCPVSIRLRLPD